MATAPPIRIRHTTTDDQPAIIELAVRALGWAGDDRDRAFLEWKHHANPFGRSPSWVATLDEQVVGFRTLLRWQFERPDGRVIDAVRAVDTATDPDHQGLGIFRSLTTTAVEELQASGIDAVFNTPNSSSRPGYLKMGWSELGRPTLGVVPRSPLTLASMPRSRQGAEKWSEPVSIGSPAAELLEDSSLSLPEPAGDAWSTARSKDYLRWRYGFDPLNYRAVEVAGGLCIFRVRRRGPSREVAICEWLSADQDRRAVRAIVKECGDYAVGIGLSLGGHGALPLPQQGPVVTWRPLRSESIPALADLSFTLGDLELF